MTGERQVGVRPSCHNISFLTHQFLARLTPEITSARTISRTPIFTTGVATPALWRQSCIT
jgi:hypothetical protein